MFGPVTIHKRSLPTSSATSFGTSESAGRREAFHDGVAALHDFEERVSVVHLPACGSRTGGATSARRRRDVERRHLLGERRDRPRACGFDERRASLRERAGGYARAIAFLGVDDPIRQVVDLHGKEKRSPPATVCFRRKVAGTRPAWERVTSMYQPKTLVKT